MKSLSERAGILIGSNAFKYAVGFLLPTVLVRLLSRSDYGTYQQLLLLGSIAVGVMPLGLSVSVYFFAHKRPPTDGRSLLAGQTLLLLSLSGAVSAAAVCLAAPWLARATSNPALVDLIPLYAPYVFGIVASDAVVHIMIAHDRYRRAVVVEALEAMLRATLLLLPTVLTGSVRALVIAVSTYGMLRFFVFWSVVKPRPALPGGRGWGPTFAREQLAYGIPLSLSMLVGLFGGLIDKAIIALSFGPEQYAIYSVGAIELPLDTILQASVANVLRASLPPLARDGNLGEMVRLVRAAVRKLSLIVVPAFVFMMAFSREFVVTAFTAKYVESVDIFRLYLLLVPLQSLVLSPVPQAFGLTRINLYISLASVSLKAALSYAFLKLLGYPGPAVATVAANYVHAGLYFFVMMRLLKRGPADLLPLGALARVTAVSLLAGILARVVYAFVSPPLLGLAAGGLTYGAVVLAGFFLTGILENEDRALLRSVLALLRPGKA